mmetsp:Transcript_123447/g.214078  ORF Transcript_123447/g.214078 Transcript_123447/m.214078 type:complete len:80 (+) Transcript_123447:1178-1417(+)
MSVALCAAIFAMHNAAHNWAHATCGIFICCAGLHLCDAGGSENALMLYALIARGIAKTNLAVEKLILFITVIKASVAIH